MKYIFILVVILFFLAGVEWLFFEVPSIMSFHHIHHQPIPLLLLVAPLWIFGYGCAGVISLVMKRATPKVIKRYLVIGVASIVLIFILGRTIGLQWLVSI